jgi:predicted amidohydrolase YtcJ
VSGAALWLDGTVYTGRRYVEALLVDGGVVVAAGDRATVVRQAPTGAERRSLGGALVIPGLVDAHLHLAELARAWEGLDLGGIPSLAGLVERVAEWGNRHPEGPVVGRGFDPERFPDRRWPTAHDLDAIDATRPIVLYHASGHAAVANSEALRRVGILAGSAGVRPEFLGRSGGGAPNGLLYEEALGVLEPLLAEGAPVTHEALERTVARLPSLGIVALGAMSLTPEEATGLRTLAERHRLPVEVRGYARLHLLDRFRPGDLTAGTDRFRVIGVKAFLDGAFGPRTAALAAPYEDDTSTAGLEIGTDGALAEALDQASARGLAPALHAIGDRAVERAARILQGRRQEGRAPPRIEHASYTPPRVLRALDDARPTLVVQPGFLWSDAWLGARLGSLRARGAYVFRTLRSRGLRLAGSSDAPYDPPDPWRGLRAAVSRRDPTGASANPDPAEALPAEEALALYTWEGWAALGGSGGTLEPGDRADALVLATPTLAGALALGLAPVRETWIGGRRAYPEEPAGVTV